MATTATDLDILDTEAVAAACQVSKRTVEAWLLPCKPGTANAGKRRLLPERVISTSPLWRRQVIANWDAHGRPYETLLLDNYEVPLPPFPDLVGIADLAEAWGCTVKHVYFRVNQSRIRRDAGCPQPDDLPEPDLRLGRSVIWRREAVAGLLNDN